MQLGPSELISPPADDSAIEQPSNAESGDPSLQSGDLSTAQASNPTAIEGLISRFNSPDTLLVFGVLLMVILMMRLLRKNYKSNRRRSAKLASPSKRITQLHTQAQASIEPAQRAMINAEEMARRLGATLDNKAARLELLIEEADRKLAILNRQLATPISTTQATTPIHPEQPIQPPPPNPTRTIDPSLLDRARMEQDFEERQTRVAGRIEPTYQDLKQTLKPDPQPQVQPQPSPQTTPEQTFVPIQPQHVQPEPVQPEPQSTQSKIIELAATGLSNIDIAHQLSQPIGQVELILNLRKQQG